MLFELNCHSTAHKLCIECAETSIEQKFKELNLHKRRKTLEEIAKESNSILRGIINYYDKFWQDDMRDVWNQLNARLLKWVFR